MRERTISIWLILAVTLVVALNLPAAVSDRGKAVIREFLAPLQELVTQTTQGVRDWVVAVRSLGEMALENQRKAEELTRLRSELRYLEGLEQENRELREQLGFLSRPGRELIAAEVIGRDMSGWWQTVRIGKGIAEGVEAGMAVVTPDGLVGRTMNVSAGTADILLITDPSCKVSGILMGSGAHGIVAGRGLGVRGRPSLRMRFINKDAVVQIGDEVVTSGLADQLPRGLLIGHVTSVAPDESGLYQVATLTPAADLSRLSYGFVVAEVADPIERILRGRDVNGGGL